MTSEISSERCLDWGSAGLGGVFSVEWVRREILPFQHTQQLQNPWNDNKRVQISRDGQVRVGPEKHSARTRGVTCLCSCVVFVTGAGVSDRKSTAGAVGSNLF